MLGAMLALLCASNTPTMPPAAHDIISGPGTPFHGGWPPPRYTGEVRATIHLAPPAKLQALCAKDFPVRKGLEYLGCYRKQVVYCPYPEPGRGEAFARCMAHELAHMRFWGVNHPL